MKPHSAIDQQLITMLQLLSAEKKKEVLSYIEKLMPKGPDPIQSRFGSAKGTFKILPGFDDEIEDFKDYI